MNTGQHDGSPGDRPSVHAACRPVPGLGPLEGAIMITLWDADGPLKVAQVARRLEYERELAYSTVMTVLIILCSKDLVRRRRDGYAWQYTAAFSRDDYLTQQVRALVAIARDPGSVVRNALGE